MSHDRQGRQLDPALIQRICRMREAGHSRRNIARTTGVSYNTVKKYTSKNAPHKSAHDLPFPFFDDQQKVGEQND